MSDEMHDACACQEYNDLTSRREFLFRTGGVMGAAAYTLSQKGAVFTLPADRLFEHSPVAAMLRY